MKLHRFAAAVATAAIAPAAFLSSTAVAADAPTPGVCAPDQDTQATPPADSGANPTVSTAPGADRPTDGAPTDGKPSGDGMDTDGRGWCMQGTTVAIHGPARFKAGGGWSELKLTVDNRHGRRFNGLVVLPMARGVKMGDFRMQFREPDGTWRDVRTHQQSGYFDIELRDGNGLHHLYKLAVGDVLTIDFRLRFAPGAAAGRGSIGATVMPVGKGDQGGYKVSNRYEFTVLPAAKKPSTESATHPATGYGAKPSQPKADGDKGTTDHPKSGVTPAVHKDGAPGTSGAALTSSTADNGTATDGAPGDDNGTATGAQLAATGASPVTPWALGGGAVALTTGAGMVLAARRRPAPDR